MKYRYHFRDLDTNERVIIEQDYKSERKAFFKAFKRLRHYGEMEIRLEKLEVLESGNRNNNNEEKID